MYRQVLVNLRHVKFEELRYSEDEKKPDFPKFVRAKMKAAHTHEILARC